MENKVEIDRNIVGEIRFRRIQGSIWIKDYACRKNVWRKDYQEDDDGMYEGVDKTIIYTQWLYVDVRKVERKYLHW